MFHLLTIYPHEPQVRVFTRKVCEPLEEDSFRPILHHYDGPKFRLELSVPEVNATEPKLTFSLARDLQFVSKFLNAYFLNFAGAVSVGYICRPEPLNKNQGVESYR